MTDEQINIAIAEACGWRDIRTDYTYSEFIGRGILAGKFGGKDYVLAIPSYITDLNEIAKAVIHYCKDSTLKLRYHLKLAEVVGRGTPDFPGYNIWDAENATALQRAEAFLRTIGKWRDS